jgi:hypothetical protein
MEWVRIEELEKRRCFFGLYYEIVSGGGKRVKNKEELM